MSAAHQTDCDRLLTVSVEIGRRLLASGAEIYRVEESIQRLLAAWGARDGEVFVIPNCIIASLTDASGQPLTRVRRVDVQGTDIYRLEAYNALCRTACAECPPLETLQARMDQIERDAPTYPVPARLGAYFVGTAAFALFFGGTWRDGVCSGVCGMAVGLCLMYMTALGVNAFFQTIAGGVISGLTALFLVWTGLGEHLDLIMIGALMALVPGMLFTNALRDIMAGDLMSGVSRAAQAMLIGGAIALGTGFALMIARNAGGVWLSWTS